MSHLITHFKQSRITLFLALGLVFFTLGSVTLFAAAPNGGYTPGQTLDPDCAPGDVDCVVSISSGGLGIGDTVIGGDPNRLLFTDSLGNLAHSQNAIFSSESFFIQSETGATDGLSNIQIGGLIPIPGLTNIYGSAFTNTFTNGGVEYASGLYQGSVPSFGNIPIMQFSLANLTTNETIESRLIDIGGLQAGISATDVVSGAQSGLSIWTPGGLSGVDQGFALQTSLPSAPGDYAGFESQVEGGGMLAAKMYFATENPATNQSVITVRYDGIRIDTEAGATTSYFNANGFVFPLLSVEPTGQEGAVYFNNALGDFKFRAYQGGAWRDLVFNNLAQDNAGSIGVAISDFDTNTNGSVFQVGDGGTNVIGWVAQDGSWTNGSDVRIKKNIRNLPYGLDTILALEPKEYEYTRNNQTSIGFIAQDVLEILPEVVSGSEDTSYGISYSSFTPVLVKAIQELNNKINFVSNGVSVGANIGELIVHKLKAHEVETDVLCLTQVSGDRVCLTAEDVAHLGEEQNMVDTTTNEPIETEDAADDTTVNQDTAVDEDTTLPEQTDEATTEEEPELTDPIENSVVTPPQIEESPVDDTAIELAPEPQGSV